MKGHNELKSQLPLLQMYDFLLKNIVSQGKTHIRKLDQAVGIIQMCFEKFHSTLERKEEEELIHSINYVCQLSKNILEADKANKATYNLSLSQIELLARINKLLSEDRVIKPLHADTTQKIQQLLTVSNPSPQASLRNTTFDAHANNRVTHYSNMSDDRYGINGAFADMMDAIKLAKSTIFLQSWLFEPDVVIPMQGVLRPGLTLHSQGDMTGAVSAYTQAIEQEPENSYAYYFAGIAEFQLSNYNSAKNNFNQAIILNPTCEDFYHGLMVCHLEHANFSQIEKIYQNAIKNKVTFKTGNLLICYADYLIKENNLGKAKEILKQASIVNRNNVNLNRVNAALLEQEGKLSEAYQAVGNYLRDKPSDAKAVTTQAHLLFLMAETEDDFKNFIKLYHTKQFSAISNQIAIDLAAANIQLKNPLAARELLLVVINGVENKIHTDKYNVSARKLLAQTYELENKNKEAMGEYRLVLQIDPHNLVGLQRYNELLNICNEADVIERKTEITKWQQASLVKSDTNLFQETDEGRLQQQISIFPYDIEALIQLADHSLKQQKYSSAIEYFDQALAIHPYDSDMQNVIARQLQKAISQPVFHIVQKANLFAAIEKHIDKGNHIEAEALLKNIINGNKTVLPDPNNFKSHQLLGLVYKAQNKMQEALAEYQIAAQIDPFHEENKANYFKLLTEITPNIAESRRAGIEKYSLYVKDSMATLNKMSDSELLKFSNFYSRDASSLIYLADSYKKKGQYQEAANAYLKAYKRKPNDYSETIIKQYFEMKIKAINQQAHTQVLLGFEDAYYSYKHSHSSLDEILVKKAIDNPDMLIAINLWNNQRKSHKDGVSSLEKIAKEKFGLNQLPDNLLIRMVSNEGMVRSFHQKYLLLDNGDQQLRAFYGGSDLATGKFDWSEHPLINTYDLPLWTSFAANNWQNQRLALPTHNGNMPRQGWRDIQSQAQGPICVDLAKDFVSHWQAGFGGAVSGYHVNSKSNERVVKHWKKISKALKPYRVNNADASIPLWECQELRSANKSSYAEWNLANKYENSIQAACLEAIKDAEKFIYWETQYFSGDEEHGNAIPRAMIEKICDKAMKNEPFHIFMALPMCPNGEPGGKIGVEPMRHTQWKLMRKMMQEIEQRTGKSWNDFLSFNFYAKWHGVTEQHHQLRKLEESASTPTQSEESFMQLVINTFNKLTKNNLQEKSISVNISQKLQDLIIEMKAKSISSDPIKNRIIRLENLYSHIIKKQMMDDSCLDIYKQLIIEFQGPSRADLVSESQRYPIYIHSKFMMVDDNIIINGSANLNARSMAGKDADGEIAVVQHPQPGHEEACQQEARSFRRKIWQDYFGQDLMHQLQDDGFANPHLPENRVRIQEQAERNYAAFASDEAGHISSKSTGLICTWPFSKKMGHVGEFQEQFSYIPDTPKRYQTPDSVYRQFPQENAKPIMKSLADILPGFKPFH